MGFCKLGYGCLEIGFIVRLRVGFFLGKGGVYEVNVFDRINILSFL